MNHFNSEEMDNLLQNSKTILFLRLQIQDVSRKPSLAELDELAIKCSINSIVLFLATRDGKKFYLIWKSNKIQQFLITKIYENCEFFNNLRLFEFIAEFLIKSLKHGHLGKFHNKGLIRD